MEADMATRKGRGSKAEEQESPEVQGPPKIRKSSKPRKPRKRRKPRVIDIDDLPPTLTIPEFARVMNCTRQHAWAEVKRGNIKTTVRLGRMERIPRPEVLRIYNNAK
jgi:hypothetical protein